MAKVALVDSPAAQVIAAALAAVSVVDSAGRTIVLKKPAVLAQFRLIKALGNAAANEVYVRMVMPLLFVAEIDGDHVPPLVRESEVEALIQRLDEHGIEAVHKGVQANFAAPAPEDDKAALGK